MLDVQLQIFKCVVEKESFSLAAQELHLTQSSVSQQIHALECYYGVKLFDRLYRRIRLTAAGAALYPYAVELERLYQATNKTMRGLMDITGGRLAIGASLTVGEYLLPKILVEFSCLYPLVNISMTVENTEKVIANVLDGSIDLGFVEGLYEPMPVLADRRCGGDRVVVVAPPKHFLAHNKVNPLASLMDERWVLREPDSGTRRVFEEFVNRHGYNAASLKIVMELSSSEAIKSAIKAGLGLGAISCLAVEDDLKRGELITVPLSEGEITRNFIMLHHREKFQTRAVEKFSSFVMENIT
ncbi:transcription regulator hth lysr [Lucifera butyrica]|uniref:Transcription regulator hth lysr n=2 Tax=Lucifera butyrica TaxID=1351585 RepID=A0A498R525_9FIRM|nr:transcription regulator hth lysr [Lucifera butyrica]